MVNKKKTALFARKMGELFNSKPPKEGVEKRIEEILEEVRMEFYQPHWSEK